MAKRYNTIANEFACTLREIASGMTSNDRATDMCSGAYRIIHAWMALERKANPRFDADRFLAYINERL